MPPVSRQPRQTLDERRQWARRFGESVRSASEEFVELVHEEIGKPRHETITAEILPLVSSCTWHARNAGRILKPRGLGRRLAGRA